MRTLRRLVTALALLGALVVPAHAAAQFDPVSPSSPAQQPTPTVVAPSGTQDSGGLQRWQELLLFGGGLALLAGIGFAIVGDARRRAPVDDDVRRTSGPSEAAVPGRPRPRDKARAKQQRKRARAARKRNAARR